MNPLTPSEVEALQGHRFDANRFECHIRDINNALVREGYFDSTRELPKWYVTSGIIEMLAKQYRMAGWRVFVEKYMYSRPARSRQRDDCTEVILADEFEAANIRICKHFSDKEEEWEEKTNGA